ncbi:hypothetical protein [Acrocarpospora catenulata]|uniref:hypothetical protein n=1 Tax=Acrocarpospora catenulata TaxID=2836182 RepID=UPI001BDAA525|nr:hypothetical protein [Acrocarpospora catenulata]
MSGQDDAVPVAAGVKAGPGRVLVAVYAVFAIAATSRAGVQLATRFEEAPVAYLLSAVAAAVYILLTVALGRGYRKLALVACGIELAGVLIVGTLSLVDQAAFPKATVWSGFGSGYLFIPLLLPIIGFIWLSRGRRA